MICTIDGIVEAAKSGTRSTMAVAAAHDDVVLEAVVAACKEGIVDAILVGHTEEIRTILTKQGEDPDRYQMVEAGDDKDCAAKAVALCSEGRAGALMKGILGTADLMRAVFKREAGLRTGRLTSHCMFFETAKYPKMLLLTDAGVNTYPDLDKKVDILENAAIALRALGYEKIYTSCICGAENVDPKIQATVDADLLSKMTDRWSKYNMTVIGPLGTDLAVSKEACRHKHFQEEGAGEADILLVPNYEMGNGIYKAASIFAGVKSAGIILGARVPIVLTSRSDSAASKLASIALGAVLSQRMTWEDLQK